MPGPDGVTYDPDEGHAVHPGIAALRRASEAAEAAYLATLEHAERDRELQSGTGFFDDGEE